MVQEWLEKLEQLIQAANAKRVEAGLPVWEDYAEEPALV